MAALHDASPLAPSASVNTCGFFDNHHARPTQCSQCTRRSSPRGKGRRDVHAPEYTKYGMYICSSVPPVAFPSPLPLLTPPFLPPLHRAGADVVLTGSTQHTIAAVPAPPAMPRAAITQDGGRAGRGGGPSSDADDARRDQDIRVLKGSAVRILV
ncbi:hypothetical protein DFH08DRAFT_902072 [Mycena albidolilacea]|uniref:Uncharacterized protein n=1 Tax=Mycena albidolilacea TaxID=1033008 RepID=A0AAD6Z3F9_9AGAR|nr:hypothetical protein DFH08DRAFT_902072 [Mycena albidolilacea]